MALPFLNGQSKKRDQVIAIDLGGRSTKAVHLQRKGDVYTLLRYCVIDAPIYEKSLSVDVLTEHVHRIETIEGILSDWSIPGEQPAASAYDVARTVCRRAERCVVRLIEAGDDINPQLLAYLNRLSDLLWLFGRLLELRAGQDARLRDDTHKGPRWSRAW